MTTVYFIRHAESDYSIRDSRIRPLTEKGLKDSQLVTTFLWDKNIDAVLSSHYKRAVDTLADFIQKRGLKIEIIEDFCEMKSGSIKIEDEDFPSEMKRLWDDFRIKHQGAENLAELQERNINALNKALITNKDKNIAIGTHGLALSSILNYYDNSFGYDAFMEMEPITPWVVKMDFVGNDCKGIEKIDLFKS